MRYLTITKINDYYEIQGSTDDGKIVNLDCNDYKDEITNLENGIDEQENKELKEMEEEVENIKNEYDKVFRVLIEYTDDEEKLEHISIFPEYTAGGLYHEKGTYVKEGDRLFRSNQGFEFFEDRSPLKSPDLWSEIGEVDKDTGLEEIKASAENTYPKDFIGTYQGRVYKSNYDNNGNIPYENSTYPDRWEDLGLIEDYVSR